MNLDKLYTNLTSQDVQHLLEAGEGQQIEFKTGIQSILDLARLVSGFANAQGGVLLVGIRENPKEIVGANPAQISSLVDNLHKRIRPLPPNLMHVIDMPDNKKVVAIVIKAEQQEIVVSDAGPYIRVGEQTRAMSRPEIQQRLPAPAEPITYQHIAESIAGMASNIETLRKELQFAQSLKGQWKVLVVGFLLGIIASVIASFIFVKIHS